MARVAAGLVLVLSTFIPTAHFGQVIDPGRKVMGAMAGKRLAYFRLSVSLAIISLSTFTRSYSVFF
jgi:hypothetical protein